MTRYYIDTEFIEDGSTIDLISIGIVAEDGRELYMQSTEFDPSKASDWVKEHVITHLVVCPHLAWDHAWDHGVGTSPLQSLIMHVVRGQCTFAESWTRHAGAYADCPWRTRKQIKHEILAFMDIEKYGKPELWGWCSGYDWVALCQLFGTMMDIPAGYPHYVRDIQQVLDERGIADDMLPQPDGQAHNALADARQIQKIWEFLRGIEHGYKGIEVYQPKAQFAIELSDENKAQLAHITPEQLHDAMRLVREDQG